MAKTVYSHLQRQSLEFHLNRETGRILRAVQRGSSSFVDILNAVVFETMPIVVKIVFMSIVIGLTYDWVFLLIIFGFMAVYLIAQAVISEWRSKFFKDKS